VVVGSSKPQKNFLRFVDAVKIMVDDGVRFSVSWYGIFPEYLDEFRKYVDTIGLGDILKVYGPTQNIGDVYHSADFFCLPSLFEGFPNVLCEAMSAGLPVACSNVCDNPYIIGKTIGGIMFNPLDVNDMSNKLKKMVSMTNEEWQQRAQINRNIAEELFSSDMFFSNYCKLL
jgi:glycosyltransferase involved in cell wall biosynthesis